MLIPQLIIPTVLIPLTVVSVILSSIASFVAALFGFKLKTEGPRRLLEALLKPRVLLSALLLNVAIYGGVKAYSYWRHFPVAETKLVKINATLKKSSNRHYPNSQNTQDYLLSEKKYQRAERTSNSPLSVNADFLWEKSLDSGSFGGFLRTGESLFVGTESGDILELDLKTGAIIRSFYIGTPITSAPIVFNNKLFVGEGEHDTHDARVYKFNLVSGEYEGAFATKGHTEGRLTIAEWQGRQVLLIPAGQDGIHAVDPGTMKSIWHSILGHSDGQALVLEGVVYFGTGTEKNKPGHDPVWAVALDLLTGREIWKKSLEASSWMQPVHLSTRGVHEVCFPMGEIYFKSEVGGVACFDTQTGEAKDHWALGGAVVARPLVFFGDLIVASFNGRVCRLVPGSSKPTWCEETSFADSQFGGVSYDWIHHALLLNTENRGLYALEPETGKKIFVWEPRHPDQWEKTYAPLMVEDGILLTADMKGKLRALLVSL